MDLAKNLAEWRDLPPEQWIARANRVLPPLAVLAIVVLLALQAARLTWRLLESPIVDEVPVFAIAPGSGATLPSAGGLEALADWHPFGRPPVAAEAEVLRAETVLDAEPTTLNLTLHGVAQAQELPEPGSTVMPEDGLAVISSGRGDERVYRPGQPIDDASGARLHSVYTDRVLLDRGGRLERLSFPERDAQTARGPQLNSNVAARSPSAAPPPPIEPASAAAMADAINNIAAVLANHMNFVPQQEGGRIIGLRIQPRGDSAVLMELGFEPGDVLTEVNGLALTDLRQTAQVFNALGESAQAQVRVRRNGTEQVLVVNIGQIEQLAESLQ